MLATNIGSKELAISSSHLGNKLIAHDKHSITFIDIHLHSDQDFPFEIMKSGNKMSVDFGRNTDETIGMNSSRTIGSHTQRLTVPG